MEITINKGTNDVIMDIEDLIVLLEYKLIALNRYKDDGLDVSLQIINTQKSHIHLQEYLLSLYKEEE
jgi:hypothetical protein